MVHACQPSLPFISIGAQGEGTKQSTLPSRSRISNGGCVATPPCAGCGGGDAVYLLATTN